MASFPGPQQIDSPFEPVPSPLRLTSVYPVRDLPANGIITGVTYETDGCGDDIVDVDFNDYEDCVRTAAKDFTEGLFFEDSLEEAISGLVAFKCRPGALGGGTIEEYADRAARRYLRHESSYLERKLVAILDSTDVEVTPGDDPYDSIGLLLENANLVDGGTLWLPLGVAVRLGAGRLGVIADSGIQPVVSPAVAANKAYLSGRVAIWGDEISTRTAHELGDNYLLAMAERQYIVAIQCLRVGQSPPGVWSVAV